VFRALTDVRKEQATHRTSEYGGQVWDTFHFVFVNVCTKFNQCGLIYNQSNLPRFLSLFFSCYFNLSSHSSYSLILHLPIFFPLPSPLMPSLLLLSNFLLLLLFVVIAERRASVLLLRLWEVLRSNASPVRPS
jgi:hypothetical protein